MDFEEQELIEQQAAVSEKLIEAAVAVLEAADSIEESAKASETAEAKAAKFDEQPNADQTKNVDEQQNVENKENVSAKPTAEKAQMHNPESSDDDDCVIIENSGAFPRPIDDDNAYPHLPFPQMDLPPFIFLPLSGNRQLKLTRLPPFETLKRIGGGTPYYIGRTSKRKHRKRNVDAKQDETDVDTDTECAAASQMLCKKMDDEDEPPAGAGTT